MTYNNSLIPEMNQRQMFHFNVKRAVSSRSAIGKLRNPIIIPKNEFKKSIFSHMKLIDILNPLFY